MKNDPRAGRRLSEQKKPLSGGRMISIRLPERGV